MTVPKAVGELISAARGNGATSWLLSLILCALVLMSYVQYAMHTRVAQALGDINTNLVAYSDSMRKQMEPLERAAGIVLEEESYGSTKLHKMVRAVDETPAKLDDIQSKVDALLSEMRGEPPARPGGRRAIGG
jgi:hypothetical protein